MVGDKNQINSRFLTKYKSNARGIIMKNYSTLQIQKEKDVATIFLHRPEKKNAINIQMVNDLTDALDTIEDTKEIKFLILRSKESLFCSGLDLEDVTSKNPPDIYGFQKWEKMCHRIENLNKITIASIEGECIGGGFQLVLLCDIRLATTRAKFAFNEVRNAFLPGLATYRLAKYVGLGKAKQLMMGDSLDARDALHWGLVNQVCEPENMLEIIQQNLNNHSSLPLPAWTLARRLMNECYSSPYENFLGHFLAARDRKSVV